MTVCSDMLELILGPINIVNRPKVTATTSVSEEVTESKEDESNQSDVSKACKAMSCSIEDSKDIKVPSVSTDLTPSSSNTTTEEKSDKGKYAYR